MKQKALGVAISLALALSGAGGCKGKSAGGASGAASAAAAGRGGCPAGAYTSPDKHFCISLPAGAKFDTATDHPGQFKESSFVDAKGNTLLTVDDYTGHSKFDDQLAGMKVDAKGVGQQKAVTSGDLPGGGFFFVVSWTANGNAQEKVVALPKGDGSVVDCSAIQNTPDMPPAIEACKSLHAL